MADTGCLQLTACANYMSKKDHEDWYVPYNNYNYG